MSKKTSSTPFQEELDATVVAKYLDVPQSGSRLHATTNLEDALVDQLSADESLEMTLLDTQDVSAWLEESLFLQPRVERDGVAKVKVEDKVIFKEEVKEQAAPLKEEHPQKAELSGFFNDFENDAPEPPPLFRKVETHEAPIAFKPPPTSGGKEDWAPKRKWVNEILRSGKRPLVGSSLIAVLALSGAVAYTVIQQERDMASIEPQALSLVQVSPAPAEQENAEIVSVEEHYCLTQGIRLGAAVQNAALSSVATPGLEALFADFAQRCENYQFVPETYLKANLAAKVVLSGQVPRGSLTPVAIEPVVASLGDLQSGGSESESPRLVPSDKIIQNARSKPVDLSRSTQTTKNIQWRLVKLGFYKERPDGKGRIDGVFNESTQAAVKAFYAQHTEFSESPVEAEIFSAIDNVYAAAK